MARQFKGDDKLFGNQAYKRTTRDVIEEREHGHGRLNDFYRNQDVHMSWSNWKGPFEDDMMFKLTIKPRTKGDTEIMLSKEQLLRWLRYV